VLVAFIEWFKDLLFLPFPIMMLVITPWRAVFLYGVLQSSLENVPLNKQGLVNRDSKRLVILLSFFKYLLLDYLTILMMILTVFTVIGIIDLV